MPDVVLHAATADDEELPAWSLPKLAANRIAIDNPLPERVDRDWAIGGATGRGVKVCILDSGVEAGHPLVGAARRRRLDLARRERRARRRAKTPRAISAATAPPAPASSTRSRPRQSSTRCACSAPGSRAPGRCCSRACAGRSSQGFDVVNMSLSTTKRQFGEVLHELADTAYFRGTILVASAHNMPVESYPWRFSSVLSVGSHEEDDPFLYYANPDPPVEFFARGVDVDVAWLGGGSIRATGNSFATPCISGHRGADSQQASEADAVPAENRALSDLGQRWRCAMTDGAGRYDAAVAAGVLASEEQFARLAPLDRRGRAGDLRREGVVGLPLRRGDRRARVRRGRGRRRAAPRRAQRCRRRRASPAGCSRRGRRSCSRTSRQDPRFARDVAEGTGYVPQGLMAVPLLDDEARARRAAGARPAAALALLAAGDGAARPVRRPGRDRARRCSARRAGPDARSKARATRPRSPSWPRRSRRSTATAATQPARCSAQLTRVLERLSQKTRPALRALSSSSPVR